MSATAKLFKHGRSQAVRLPKAFRFEGVEVRITQVGDRVILEPAESRLGHALVLIDATGDTPFMAEGRDQPSMPDDRIVFET